MTSPNRKSFAMEQPGDAPTLREVRRDLRCLIWLESVQMGVALLILVSVGLEAVITATEMEVAFTRAVALALALAFVALAIRVRVGQTLLYRDVYALEAQRSAFAPRAPYRSPSPPEGVPEHRWQQGEM